jgi:hypothetical protein
MPAARFGFILQIFICEHFGSGEASARCAVSFRHLGGTCSTSACPIPRPLETAPVPFVIAGVPIARDALLSGAGLDLAIGRHATLGVAYIGQLAGNVQDHAAKGRFSWKC